MSTKNWILKMTPSLTFQSYPLFTDSINRWGNQFTPFSSTFTMSTSTENLSKKKSGRCERRLQTLKSRKRYQKKTYDCFIILLRKKEIQPLQISIPDLKKDLIRNESNTLSDRRNTYLTFGRSNKYWVGLNLLSNRLQAVSGFVQKVSISYSKNMFKTYC